MKMRNIIIQFSCGLIFILFQQCTPNASAPQEHRYNHPDGSLRRRYFMIDNQIEGEMTEYYPKTGQIHVKRLFKKGVQTGRTQLFYPDGKLKEVQYYEGGKKHRGDTIFYPNGKPQFLVTFKDGKMDGYMRKWTEDGKLFFEARYQQDSLKEVTKIMHPQTNIH